MAPPAGPGERGARVVRSTKEGQEVTCGDPGFLRWTFSPQYFLLTSEDFSFYKRYASYIPDTTQDT